AEQVLASQRHRLVYRPHPRSGVVDDEYLAAHRRIVARITEANIADPGAHHVFDESPQLDWQLTNPDVAICDISAMVYDRLATGKPVMVTRPVHAEAEIDAQGYLQECEWLTSAQSQQVLPTIDRLVDDEATAKRLGHWSEYYFGDTSQGAPTR